MNPDPYGPELEFWEELSTWLPGWLAALGEDVVICIAAGACAGRLDTISYDGRHWYANLYVDKRSDELSCIIDEHATWEPAKVVRDDGQPT